MDDQTAIRYAVRAAVETECQRIVTALGTVINDRSLSEYADDAASYLPALVPGFDRGTWVDVYGNAVGQPHSPYSCCGYCPDCEEHCGDGDDSKCDMGHCHDCEHRCDQ